MLFVLLFAYVLHHKHINKFPSHIHAWTQADRYALAKGFVDNDLNLFLPQTFLYHKVDKNKNNKPTELITPVDFPIHDFVVATIMKISGNESPKVFRIYILLYSLFGIWFFMQLALLMTNDLNKTSIAAILLISSPVFIYYQSGFLPTIPSLSNVFIASYYYYCYSKNKKIKHFALSILFFSLACLSRLTFAIPLFALICNEFVRFLRVKKIHSKKLILILLSVIIIVGYYFYNQYLKSKYGSMFLNQLIIASSLDEVKDILNYIYHHWFFDYFTRFHYFVFALLLLYFVFKLFKKRKFGFLRYSFSSFISIYLLGCVLFFFLMTKQFKHHDYYFLDTFYAPIILLFLYGLSKVSAHIGKVWFFYPTLIIAGLLLKNGISSQENRYAYKSWDRYQSTANNFEGSNAFLDSLEIPKDAKMLVIDAYAPNIPLILMDRKGLAIINTRKDHIEEALSWDFDYIVFQNEFFIEDVYYSYPNIINLSRKIGDNGKITIAKIDSVYNNEEEMTIEKYIGIENQQAEYFSFSNFEDTSSNAELKNIKYDSNYRFDGQYSCFSDTSDVYGVTFKSNQWRKLEKANGIAKLNFKLGKVSSNDVEIVISTSENGNNTFYRIYDPTSFSTQLDEEWTLVNFLAYIPKVNASKNYEVSIYLINKNKKQYWVDDFELSLY